MGEVGIGRAELLGQSLLRVAVNADHTTRVKPGRRLGDVEIGLGRFSLPQMDQKGLPHRLERLK